VTTGPGSPEAEAAPPAAATAEVLALGPTALLGPGTDHFAALVSWLVTTARPTVAVELGPGDESSLRSTSEAVLRPDVGGTCVAVLLRSGSETAAGDFRTMVAELSGRAGPHLRGYESEEAALAALGGGTVGLVHLSLSDSDELALPDLAAWDDVLAPGALMVVTTTSSDASSNFAKAKQHLADTYPAVTITLGLTAEAVVAQRPADEGAPIVEMLRKAPYAVGAFLALFGEQVDLQHLLQHEPEPSQAVRVLIGRVIDQQRAERAAFLSALRVQREEAARLSREVVAARSELAGQMEAARREREHLVAEFLDRVDELSAKVSTTASRYAAALADKDALLEAEGRKVEAYAGKAADAQSVLDDMERSTSWRITAPVRLLSRLLAARAQPPAQAES
jgi:hypothetical protein